MKITTITTMMAAAMSALAQLPPVTVLEVQVENYVQYVGDVSDFTKLATDPKATTAAAKTFGTALILGDITAVNGKPARGAFVINQRTLNLRDSFTPGTAIADVVRGAISNYALEVLAADGTPIGDIYAAGFSAGVPPPGAPSSATQSSNAILGGTGAFLGARGQVNSGPTAVALRVASVTEDPANRRTNSGGKTLVYVSLIPLFRPEIVMTSSGPVVFHSDISPVTAAKPAKPGEVLIAMATGLGPTRPGVDPGQPFPADPASPLQMINSPVDVTVNGQAAELVNAIGWPGLVDTYRVDFRVPTGTASGTAGVQLSAAWIGGSSFNIPIQ
jgi:uncharacterized protein (TIGR03437 family)